MNLKQINKKTLILAIVLAVILIGSIILFISGGGEKDTENNTQSTETTNSTGQTLKQRYIFTNNIAGITDFSALIETEADTTLKLIRFEKKDVLKKIDNLALKNLTKGADSLSKESALKLGSEEIPTKQGIYRSVLEIKDAAGNTTYEEVIIILDTANASINDAEDLVIEVPKDKISEKPEIDTTVYKGYDEVDGNLTYKQLKFDLTLMDEAKHEWKLTISYTDRAGNYSEELYKVTVVEEKKQTAGNNTNTENNSSKPGNNNTGNNNTGNTKPGNGTTSNGGNTGNTDVTGNGGNGGTGGSNTDNTGNTGNNNTGNTGNTGNGDNGSTDGSNTGNSNGGGNISDIAPDINKYDPMDANKDGSVSAEEEMMYITPAKQKCIDAGYGVVVEQDGGEWYAVLMESNKHTIDGKRGGDILDEYLKERGLHADRIGGCWINPDNGWYWYTAEQIEEIPEDPMGDDFNWEDGEIEWH